MRSEYKTVKAVHLSSEPSYHLAVTTHWMKMPRCIQLVVTLSLAVLFGLWTEFAVAQLYLHTYSPIVTENSGQTCPTKEDREAVRDDIAWNVRRLLTLHDKTCGGTGGWALVTHINMSNSSHQCPGNYRQVTRDGLRLCACNTATNTEPKNLSTL